MVDIVLIIRSELVWDLDESRKKIISGGPVPLNLCQTPDISGLNPPNQLLIGYHWLAFQNKVRKNILRPQFTINDEWKNNHTSKTKETHELKNPFQNIAHLLRQYRNSEDFYYCSWRYSKYCKIEVSFV